MRSHNTSGMRQPSSAQERSVGVGRERTAGMGTLQEIRLLVYEDPRRFYPIMNLLG
jgi:hypothetical protein